MLFTLTLTETLLQQMKCTVFGIGALHWRDHYLKSDIFVRPLGHLASLGYCFPYENPLLIKLDEGITWQHVVVEEFTTPLTEPGSGGVQM